MGARRRCCCPEGCWFFYDDFGDGTTRNNTTNLGSHWNEVTGDWGISGWMLIENYATGGGTANALLMCTDQVPLDSAGDVYQGIDIYTGEGGAVTGDIFYLYPVCVDDETAGFEVKFECLSAPGSWRVTCGSETKDFTILPDEWGWVQAWCCIDGEGSQAKAWMNPGINEFVWDDDCSPGTGRYSGLGHNNAVASPNIGAVLDNYFIGELRTETGYVCFDCLCRCGDYVPKRELTLTITNATGRASCMDGETTTITWEWNAGSPRWKGTLKITGDNSYEWTGIFYLECETEHSVEYPGENFVLSHDPSNACCVANQDLCNGARATEDSTCVPFNLVFGPYALTCSDLACWLCWDPGDPAVDPPPPGGPECDWEDPNSVGEYYIEITA